MEITFTKVARPIFDLQEKETIPLQQVIKMIDSQHYEDLNKAIEEIAAGNNPYYYKLMVIPIDDQPAKLITGAAIVIAERDGKPEALKGIIMVDS